MNPADSYAKLFTSLREISLLDSIGSLMGWDEHTYLPPKGTAHRADQQALIATMSHQRFTSPQINDLLRDVEASDLMSDPESDVAVNVRETRRLYDRAV